MTRKAESTTQGGVARQAAPVVVFLVGAAITLAVFGWLRAREHQTRRLEFERRAVQVAVRARVSFDIPLEVVRSVPALFEASEDVTRAEFKSFVSGALERYTWIYALEWIPRVPGSERARYEAAAAADGLTGYRFKQDSPSGPPVVAQQLPEYFPLFYMEPPNPTALGIEETALEQRKTALLRARDLGTTIASERLSLVQDDPSVASVIAFHPIYRRGARPASVEARRESLRGFAAVVFRVRPVIESALSDADFESMDVVLLDTDASSDRAVLYASRQGAFPFADHTATHAHEATIAGRRWKFVVGDRAGWVRAGGAGYAALGVGLFASLLAAGFARALASVLRLRRQVSAARRLGQYTLVEKLGEGGMGTVYRAHHAMLRRPTAIKLLHPGRTSEAAVVRFEREVQLTSALTHPNTVVIYDYGRTEQGVFYYAMEYIDGITLQDLVDSHGAQPAGRVIPILEQIAGALAEAHAVGLVHRDVKPANVMLCARGGVYDFVKVVDFGLVKDRSVDDDLQLTQGRELIGTPLYLAPEAILGKQVDARADIYAVGAVAYYMLTGSPVFDGRSVVDICSKHLSVPPEPLVSRLGVGVVDPALESLVLRCLAKDPEDRPASADELKQAFSALDIPRWGRDQAQRWWREHGRDEGAPSTRPLPIATTVEIDPLRRDGESSLDPLV